MTKKLTSNRPDRPYQSRASKEVFLRVKFGMRSLDCRRFGICYIDDADVGDDDDEKMYRSAVARVRTTNGRLIMDFKKKTISDAHLRKMDKEGFRMGETFEVPHHACQKVGLTNYKILRGLYKIEKHEDYYIVQF